MSSTQLTEATRGLLMSVCVVEAKLTLPCSLTSTSSVYAFAHSGETRWKSKPAQISGKSFLWRETLTSELQEIQSIHLRLALAKFLLKDQTLARTIIPAEDLNKGKGINWYPLQLNNVSVGKILVSFICEDEKSEVCDAEPKQTTELELAKLEMRFGLQCIQAKLAKLKQEKKMFRMYVQETLHQNSSGLKTQLGEVRIQRADVQASIRQVQRERKVIAEKVTLLQAGIGRSSSLQQKVQGRVRFLQPTVFGGFSEGV